MGSGGLAGTNGSLMAGMRIDDVSMSVNQ